MKFVEKRMVSRITLPIYIWRRSSADAAFYVPIFLKKVCLLFIKLLHFWALVVVIGTQRKDFEKNLIGSYKNRSLLGVDG